MKRSWKKLSLRGLVGSVVLAAALGIVAILGGSFGELQGRVLLSTGVIGVMSVLGLACGSHLDREPKSKVARAGIAAALASALLSFPIIWGDQQGRVYVRVLFTVVIAAVAAAHLCLLWLASLAPNYRWSQKVAMFAISLAALLLMIVIWGDVENDLMWRALGVIGITDAAMTLMIPIFHRMSAGFVDPDDRLGVIDAELARLSARMRELEQERERLGAGR